MQPVQVRRFLPACMVSDSAEADKEVPIYLTGEFFAAGLVLPKNVSVDDVEVPLRNLGIFLK